MSTHRPYADIETVFGLSPGGRGLTDAHFREVVRLVCRLPGRWLIERCEDEFGAAFVLLAQDAEGADGPTFALFRYGSDIGLDLFLGECLDSLGTFGTVRQAMDRAMEHVSRTPPRIGRGGAFGAGGH